MSDRLRAFTESLLSDIENDEDGSFKLEEKNGRAWLRVYPAGKKGKPVDEKHVFSRLDLLGITAYNREQSSFIVKKVDGREYDIGNWQKPDAEDSELEIHVTSDMMAAYITIHRPKFGGNDVSYNELVNFLKENRIKSGIKSDVLKALANEAKYGEKILVASGAQPVASTNGEISVLF